MDINKSGTMSFGEYLEHTVHHIAAQISNGPDRRPAKVLTQAARDTSSVEYRELYQLLLHNFRVASAGLKGYTTIGQFDLIEELRREL